MLDACQRLEADIWGIAARVYTPEQTASLRRLIDDWRSAHPDAISVAFVRLGELGDARQVEILLDAGRPGSLLAPVREASHNIEEMRLLAERLAFRVSRMQLLLSLQFEMAIAEVEADPEVQQLLDDSETFAGASDRAAEACATLAADLPEERRVAIEQILGGLGKERERIFDDLGSEDGKLRPAVRDLRDTFEQARLLAVLLNQFVVNADELVAKVTKNEPARPFDIMDYQATLAEATATHGRSRGSRRRRSES